MASWVQRMVGAARLDAATYEEVEADTRANGQALAVVILSALAAGIGGLLERSHGPFVGLVLALFEWVIWAFLIWLIGTKILPEPETRSDVGELLRTTGFAASPGILRVVGPVPILGTIVNVVVWVWMLATMVVAARQALDYRSTVRAVVVCAIGFAVQILVVYLFGALIGAALVGIWRMP
jgi:hypothetical protein